MTAQELKNSILQWAVQGKLVEQRVEEGTARELIEQIKAEKEQLIKDKKIKKEKPLPEITEEEIPFDIPESWEWVRFGELGHYKKGPFGSALTKGMFVPKGKDTIKVYEQKNAIQKNADLGEYYITNEYYNAKMKGFEVFPGDIIVSCAGTIGETYVMPQKFEKGIINQALMRMKLMSKVYVDYFLIYFDFILKKAAIKSSKGSAIKNIPPFEELKSYLVAMPPLKEQKRIVAKIEELMSYVEQYDKAYTKLETFNKKFPEDMQKSILQYAIQGKLVEQRAEEGTAEQLYQQIQEEKIRLIKEGKIKKEKSLPEITEDEIPFDIPESWKWVRLGSLCEKIGSGSTPKGGKSVYKESGIKFLRSQNIYNDGLRMEGIVYISQEQNRPGSTVRAKDILLNITGGSIGRCALVPDDFDLANINQHVMIIRNVLLDNRFFLHTVLISPYIQQMIMSVQVGVSREGLSAEKLKTFLVPLPPLEEQKRMVAKIEEMLPYCKQLIK